MTRIVKLYKRLLDISLLTSYALLVLLVFFMLYGVFSGAYQFTDPSKSMIKDGFAFLRTSLILIVTTSTSTLDPMVHIIHKQTRSKEWVHCFNGFRNLCA